MTTNKHLVPVIYYNTQGIDAHSSCAHVNRPLAQQSRYITSACVQIPPSACLHTCVATWCKDSGPFFPPVVTHAVLLYGGAIHEAGEVKARASGRSATSDWMALEKQRGISITSTAMTFEFLGNQINLLDTPGHQDFSEDTYRTLAAADNAVLLVDGAKGIEPQTRKLFAVARLRGLPVFTFVNKMDRWAWACGNWHVA